jgi:tRNA-specific 2-thiouridylase
MTPSPRGVVVAMSGGVDSSVAALLLRRAGFDVTGLWLDLGVGGTAERARAAAARIDIPLRTVDARERFAKAVVAPCRDAYLAGRTPNPCALCNPRIKFALLAEAAVDIGGTRIATGHYARVAAGPDGPELRRGVDTSKDQSYFLFALEQGVLASALFPLGDRTKDEVRRTAAEAGLDAARAAESQDCCFDPLPPAGDRPGEIVDIEGRVLGRHEGIARYTIGQRRGLGVAGGERLYVVDLDAARGRVVLGPRERVLGRGLTARLEGFGRGRIAGRFEARCRIRYRHEAAPAVIERIDDERFAVLFDEPQEALTPGQAAVVFDGDLVLGGGFIEGAGAQPEGGIGAGAIGAAR